MNSKLRYFGWKQEFSRGFSLKPGLRNFQYNQAEVFRIMSVKSNSLYKSTVIVRNPFSNIKFSNASYLLFI